MYCKGSAWKVKTISVPYKYIAQYPTASGRVQGWWHCGVPSLIYNMAVSRCAMNIPTQERKSSRTDRFQEAWWKTKTPFLQLHSQNVHGTSVDATFSAPSINLESSERNVFTQLSIVSPRAIKCSKICSRGSSAVISAWY